jgi:hypothetical protein
VSNQNLEFWTPEGNIANKLVYASAFDGQSGWISEGSLTLK